MTAMPQISDELLATLSPQELLEYEQCLETLVGGESLREFITRCFPHEPVPRHLDPLVDVIEYARIKPIRIGISYGPGHAKTTTLLRSIVWWLHRSPVDECIYQTYSAGAAHAKSRLARDFAEQSGLELATDSRAVGHWRTIHGGGLIATGAKGSAQGKRVPGLFVVDDPYKDEFEARSPLINGQVIDRAKSVVFTRLQGGSAIFLHTRWAELDLIGYFTKELGWDSINIPSVCDTVPDVLGRKMDEVAWPEKYPYEICSGPCGHDGHLKEIRETIGEHHWAAMYQGRPRPLGTAVFHEPARYKREEFKWDGKRGVISIDPAATAKTSADWSVLMVLAMEGYGVDTRTWIYDLIRVQCEIPELVKTARRLQLQYKLMIACEAVAGFKGVPQMLRTMDVMGEDGQPLGKLRVIDVQPGSRDKFARAQPGAAAWNGSRVMVPIDRNWAEPMVGRFQRFTGAGREDDNDVDAFSQGFNLLYRTKKPEEKRMYDGGGL